MTEYEIVKATEAHAIELATNLREADVREIWASYHLEPLEALRLSVAGSRDTKVGLADGKVVCMFGVMRFCILGFIGSPWMVGAKELPQHACAFLRRNKAYINRLKNEFDLLESYVDARNMLSIRWLKWLGFKIFDPKLYGLDQIPFHRFEMRGI